MVRHGSFLCKFELERFLSCPHGFEMWIVQFLYSNICLLNGPTGAKILCLWCRNTQILARTGKHFEFKVSPIWRTRYISKYTCIYNSAVSKTKINNSFLKQVMNGVICSCSTKERRPSVNGMALVTPSLIKTYRNTPSPLPLKKYKKINKLN